MPGRVTLRQCAGHGDFPAISDFLYSLYLPHNRDGNWFQPIWEYAYTHPYFDHEAVSHIGIWEDDGQIVALALYELGLGEAFFQVRRGYEFLKPEMLAYAEQNLAGAGEDGRRYLKAFVNDFDADFMHTVQARGYVLKPGAHRPMSEFVIPRPFPPIRLPEGFRLKSLADDNDLVKTDRCCGAASTIRASRPPMVPQAGPRCSPGRISDPT